MWRGRISVDEIEHEASYAVLHRNILGKYFSNLDIVKLVTSAVFFLTDGPIVAVVRSATCQIKHEHYLRCLSILRSPCNLAIVLDP